MSFSQEKSTAPRNPLPGHLSKYRTPFHIYHEQEALEDAAELKKGLKSGLSGVELYYSVKTNPLLPLLRSLLAAGWGMEVVGPENLEAAIQAGCPGNRMLYNGAAWTKEDLEYAIFEKGIRHFTVDSPSAAAALARACRGKKLHVAIRLHDGESHFGVPTHQLHDVLKNLPETEQLGFHVHRNPSGSAESLESIRSDFARRCEIIQAALNAYANVHFFDLGGGIDSPFVYRPHPAQLGEFHNPESKPPVRKHSFTLEEAGRAVANTIREKLGVALEGRRVLLEPGRAVCTRALSTVITVKAVKQDFYPGKQVVITDGSTAALGPLHRGVYPIEPKGDKPTFVYGCLPHGADWLFQNAPMPELKEGDRLHIHHTGAYFLPLEARFGHGLPAILRADRDERIR